MEIVEYQKRLQLSRFPVLPANEKNEPDCVNPYNREIKETRIFQ